MSDRSTEREIAQKTVAMIEILGRCICLALSFAVLGLSIMMTIVPKDYGSPGDLRGGDGMKAPLFTYIFVSSPAPQKY